MYLAISLSAILKITVTFTSLESQEQDRVAMVWGKQASWQCRGWTPAVSADVLPICLQTSRLPCKLSVPIFSPAPAPPPEGLLWLKGILSLPRLFQRLRAPRSSPSKRQMGVNRKLLPRPPCAKSGEWLPLCTTFMKGVRAPRGSGNGLHCDLGVDT